MEKNRKNIYMYLMEENAKLLKAIFIEKSKNNVEVVGELLEQLKDNMEFLQKLDNKVSRETLESEEV